MGKKIRITESQLNKLIHHKIVYLTENNEITSASLLRKLSLKSIIGFGKYSEWTVQKVIDFHKKGYLRWVYYNINGISFLDDVLKEIGIIGDDYDYRIEKPGSDPELGEKVNQDKTDGITSLTIKKRLKKDFEMNKLQKQISQNKFDNRYYSKSSLQNRNHGKY